MRRVVTSAVAALALLAVLSGCSGAFPLPLPIPPRPGGPSTESPLVAPAAEECLDGTNGPDADWRSGVACTEPHLYDVLSIGEWPELDDTIAKNGAARVYRAINSGASESYVTAYWQWARNSCEAPARDAFGWGDLDPRFDELHVLPVGNWLFDMSLATRADFTAGEHRSLCSISWGEPRARASGDTIADDFRADTTTTTEECWLVGSTSTPTDCAAEHTDQAILRFDARAAFGDGFLAPESELSDTDWRLAYATCADLVSVVLPDIPVDLTVWAWASVPDQWDALADEAPAPGDWYTMDCLLGSEDGSRFTGDLLDGAQPTLVPGPLEGTESA